MAKTIADEMKKESAQWLHMKFISWESANKKHSTLAEFSKYLDVKEKLLSKWMNAVYTPRDENVIKLANKLGGEIYDILKWPHPTPPAPTIIIEERPPFGKHPRRESKRETAMSLELVK